MKTSIKAVWTAVLVVLCLILAVVLYTQCLPYGNSTETPADNKTVSRIKLTTDSDKVSPGGTVTLRATVTTTRVGSWNSVAFSVYPISEDGVGNEYLNAEIGSRLSLIEFAFPEFGELYKSEINDGFGGSGIVSVKLTFKGVESDEKVATTEKCEIVFHIGIPSDMEVGNTLTFGIATSAETRIETINDSGEIVGDIVNSNGNLTVNKTTVTLVENVVI